MSVATERTPQGEVQREQSSRLDTHVRESPMVMLTLGSGVVLALSTWGLLAGALFGTALCGTYLLTIRERNRRIEALASEWREARSELEAEIQERAQAEERLRAYARSLEEGRAQLERSRVDAESASRAKTEFLANMSHEIRTPINGIVGMAALLCDSELAEDQVDFVRTIETSAEALLAVLDDVLDLARLEAGQVELDLSEFDLRACLAAVSEVVYPAAAEKGLELVWLADAGVPRTLRGDVARLRQVLVNLLGNAVKFTAQGEVVVHAEIEGCERGWAHLKVSVSDTGIGIESENLPRLFAPFTQLDASTTRAFGGTGLGLALCKQLVEMMGGEIGVESQVGRGSRFWFRIALRVEEDAQPSDPALSPSLAQGARVLVVDDSPMVCQQLQELCGQLGLECESALSAEDGFSMARSAAQRSEPHDVVLLDALLESGGGVELASRMRLDPDTAGLGLSLLAVHGSSGDPERLRERGLDAWVSKPIDAAKLARVLDQCLRARVQERLALEAQGASALAAPSATRAEGELGAPAPDPQQDPADEVGALGLEILLAEDNLVNQKVAVLTLRKLGCKVTTAANGQEAVRAVAGADYDLVLMDCQMPVLSGYDATRAIRATEESEGLRHLPIVALTANAMKGDREKCLESGMDDYLSKPFRQDQLQDVLERWGRRAREERCAQAQEKETQMHSESQSPLDMDVIAGLKELGGEDDPELFAELVDLFLQDTPPRLVAIGEALAERNGKGIEETAHALKSSCGNLGAMQLADLCRKIEAGGREEQLEAVEQLIDRARMEFQRVSDALQELVA